MKINLLDMDSFQQKGFDFFTFTLKILKNKPRR